MDYFIALSADALSSAAYWATWDAIWYTVYENISAALGR